MLNKNNKISQFKKKWWDEHVEEKIKLSERSKKNKYFLGKKHSKESKKKISESLKGHKVTNETKSKISQKAKNRLGHRNGFYGKTHSGEFKNLLSARNKRLWKNSEYRMKMKKMLSEKNKQLWKNPEYRMKMISVSKKNWEKLEYRNRMSKVVKNNWQTPEIRDYMVKKIMLGNLIKPNKPELQLQSLLNNLYPNDWQYVGDGKVILEGFCPDFINVNGKKQIIELNGDYWHNRQGAAEKDKRKVKAYKQLGYKTLTVWEHELKNVNKLKNKIERFI